jgi:alkanesulfonate monooxygenase SsuD/methylene tetrahydromethanopterin reductase-like flavin-dependent oxidoreductase (luciferase family)
MRFGLDLSPAGPWGKPRKLAELAALAERSGWDGVFLEDYIVHPLAPETYDPWVALTAIALATERIRLGTLVTPVPRRSPFKLAAEAMSVDHVSDGRMILGVGVGDWDLRSPASLRERAAQLDASLTTIAALWAGDEVDGTRLAPRPVQQPRIPIWVGGALTRRGPRARALRWDGAALYRIPPPDWEDLRPEDVAALRAAARPDFDIAVGGRERNEDEAADREYLAAIAEAGATWWHEFLAPSTTEEAVRQHIERGPLR